MAAKKMTPHGLGRGLSALLGEIEEESAALTGEEIQEGDRVVSLLLADIDPNRDQPRKTFDEESLAELSASIKAVGVIQPIVVTKRGARYSIIAGERRWRASRMAGLSAVPAIVRELSDEQAALLSLIENLQRENLNPVEEALGYRDLIERFGLTQEEAASRVGKSRANVTNILRILRLPESVLAIVRNGSLSYGHARTLVPLCDKCDAGELLAVAERIAKEDWSVRQTEQFVKNYGNVPIVKAAESPVEKEYYRRLERLIGKSAGRKAAIRREKNGSGKLVLSFASSGDLEALIKSLCGNDFFEEETQD